MYRFAHKHVLITGAARGIGFEIACRFAAEGATLSLFDFHEENLLKAAGSFEKKGTKVWLLLLQTDRQFQSQYLLRLL